MALSIGLLQAHVGIPARIGHSGIYDDGIPPALVADVATSFMFYCFLLSIKVRVDRESRIRQVDVALVVEFLEANCIYSLIVINWWNWKSFEDAGDEIAQCFQTFEHGVRIAEYESSSISAVIALYR
jgi:hypothetical protein